MLLAQKFTNSEDITFKKLKPSGACRLCRSSLGTPPRILSPMVAIGQLSFGRIRSLVWPAASSKDFLEVFTRRHVARATLHQSLRDWYHRFSAVLPRRMVPHQSRSDHLFRLQVPKCLDTQPHTHTNTIEPTFFSDPPEEIFDHNTFNPRPGMGSRITRTGRGWGRICPPPLPTQLL